MVDDCLKFIQEYREKIDINSANIVRMKIEICVGELHYLVLPPDRKCIRYSFLIGETQVLATTLRELLKEYSKEDCEGN